MHLSLSLREKEHARRAHAGKRSGHLARFHFQPTHTQRNAHSVHSAAHFVLYTHAELNDYYEYVAQLLRSTTAAA